MKKLFFSAVTILFAALCFTACMDDDDEETKVECQYGGTLQELSGFDDPDDSLTYYALISEAFSDLGIIGENSIFTINVAVNISSESYAYYVADYRADSLYQTMLYPISLSTVKSTIYANHSDSLADLGYTSADDISLGAFTATFALYSARSTEAVETYDKDF